MITDAQGLELTGATAVAAAALDAGARAATLSYGDALSHLNAALAAAPGCPMAHIAKAWMFALANDSVLVVKADPLIAAAAALPLNDRERAHIEALRHVVKGHRRAAAAVLDRHLMHFPHDLLAHHAGLLVDAFQGRFHNVRDRSARALPCWSKEQPGYGILLSFYGFGLEEAGEYQRAEDVARAAAEREPHGYWPHHAVSHVMEMTARPTDGLKWMDEREALWAGEQNTSRVHIWWHKALFHVELGDYEAALAIYDGPIVTHQRPIGISLTNATALLWRLELLGLDGGDRWQSLAALWEGHADGRLCMFADIHAAMTAMRAGRDGDVARLLEAMARTAGDGTEKAPFYGLVGVPVVEGLRAFNDGRHGEALDRLLAARADVWRMGGSLAQRDVIDWTLNVAAARAGAHDVAIALANERLAQRPRSAPNQHFLRAAEAVAA